MSNLLGICWEMSGLRKTIQMFKKNENFPNKDYALKRIHAFFGLVLAGTLEAPREEWQKLIPEGAGLGEAARATNYASEIWSSKKFITIAPKSRNERFLERMRSYARGTAILSGKRQWKELEIEEKELLEEISVFTLHLEEKLLGELNSLSVS